MQATILKKITPSKDFCQKEASGAVSSDAASKFREFIDQVNQSFIHHPIVEHNPYTHWFSTGSASLENLQDLTIQFSVFSNHFLIAQLKKMIHSQDLKSMRLSKEILANEIGVVYRDKNSPSTTENDLDSPELLGLSGTIDGSRFHFKAAHFEWLLDFAKPLGLEFSQLGRLSLGTEETRFFCLELERLYGSEDPNVSSGAGFAIENWAAAGFWQELVDGLTLIKNDWMSELPLHFWSWHNLIESQHASHTHQELEALFLKSNFNKRKFLEAGRQILFAVEIFWQGLEGSRIKNSNN